MIKVSRIQKSDKPKSRTKARSAKPAIQTGFTKSRDGTRIWYRSAGSGTPIVFCNGLGCAPFYWKHIAAHFEKTAQVVTFDWRAHGQSDQPKGPNRMTLKALMEDLQAVLKELKIKKAIFAGHSMGGQVLYNYYAKHSNQFLALIPCCSTFARPMDTFFNSNVSRYVFDGIYVFNHLFPKAANAIGLFLAKNPFWFQAGAMLDLINPGLVDRKVMNEYMDHVMSIDPIQFTDLLQSLQENDAEPILSKIRTPTLIVAADKDRFTPVWLSQKAHSLIKDSELMVIKKATHVALIEQPALINLRIEKFLQERLGWKNASR